ncbi:MAG: trehalase-like domain-containing protein, partial [Acidimicrobiales bacterium]
MAKEISESQESAEEFPPHVLREYALLADGERGALIGPRGDLAWMCAPRWHSDGVFSSLIGGGGRYAVTPRDPRFVWGGYYEDGSLIWHSRWVTTTGVIECREALAFPGDPDTVVVLRRVMAVQGEARVRVSLEARADFGRRGMTSVEAHDGIWTARSGALRLRWSGADGATPTAGGALGLDLTIAAGSHHDLVLEMGDHTLADHPVDAGGAWQATEAGWRQTVPDMGGLLAARDARHAYVVLRGLTSGGGGMVAAATMSLPERARA